MNKDINPRDAYKLMNEKRAVIIDVRSPSEFENAHIKGSYNIPLSELEKHKNELKKLDLELIAVCRSGNRSTRACELISDSKIASSLDGGVMSWENLGLPLEKKGKKWELERQVRLIAGLLVLLGVILGFGISKWFFLLSGFVGAGLSFAAITNTCLMGEILARLPYNKPKTYDSNREIEKLLMKGNINTR